MQFYFSKKTLQLCVCKVPTGGTLPHTDGRFASAEGEFAISILLTAFAGFMGRLSYIWGVLRMSSCVMNPASTKKFHIHKGYNQPPKI